MNSIKQIEVIYADRVAGRLALTKEGLCAFEYSTEWLAPGFSISPFELPLRSGVFIAKPRPFDGGFGVFDNCLPDGWGLLIRDPAEDHRFDRRGRLPRLPHAVAHDHLLGRRGDRRVCIL